MRNLFFILLAAGTVSAQAATYTKLQAHNIFEHRYGKHCELEEDNSSMDEMFEFSIGNSKYQVFSFVCEMFAYNATGVVAWASDNSDLQFVALAVPDVSYDENAPAGQQYTVTGMRTEDIGPFGTFDVNAMELHTFYKGRGIGDAFTAGTYKFDEEGFTLKKYDADFSFDGEINPGTVINY